MGIPGGEPRPLWNAMVTLEALRRPAGLIAIAATSADFAEPARVLEQDIREQALFAERRERDGGPVVLVW